MSETSSMLLLGIGGAGCEIVRGVGRAFGPDLRYVCVDTDARSGEAGGPFVLLGGDRLSGRGAGGDIVSARMAAADSVGLLDESLEGVRLAVIATSLGGGTGGGVTVEVLRHLGERGIPSVAFATMPFAFEGEDRQRNARGIVSMVEGSASASFILELDKLVAGEDNMQEAMRRAIGQLATGITLFWRVIEKPGYLSLDSERLRRLVTQAGRGRFATVTFSGPDRARDAVDALVRSPLIAAGSGPVKAILCGILAGDDLRLSEVGTVAEGLKSAFGDGVGFAVGTVNDEETFAGRLSAVAMLFESDGRDEGSRGGKSGGRRGKPGGAGGLSAVANGRFTNCEPTFWRNENLDTPTYLRRGIVLEF